MDDPIDAYVNRLPITFFGRSETLDTISDKEHAGAALQSNIVSRIPKTA